jgi:hypothetical protein
VDRANQLASKNPLEDYLREMRKTHDSGAAVPETSYYPHLLDLLNAAGAQLKPKVRCILNPANRGAGIPDLGLYTPDQYLKAPGEEPPIGTLPSRGVVEAKPTTTAPFLAPLLPTRTYPSLFSLTDHSRSATRRR